MKKTIHIALAAAAAALAAAGCAKFGEPDAPEEQEITITASFAEEQTKTTLQDGGTAVYWETGEEIKLFYGTESGKFTSTNTSNSPKVSFLGSLNVVIGESEGVSETSRIWGLYPYRSDATFDGSSVTTVLPSKQTGKAGSFAKDMNISLANSSNYLLGFYNVCGGVRFSVSRDDIKNVVFEALNGESLAGKVKLKFEGGVPVVKEVIEGVDSISLSAPGDGVFEVGKWYYVIAFPNVLKGGFKMVFNTDSQYATMEHSEAVTFRRSIFGQLSDADKGLHFYNRGYVPISNIILSDSKLTIPYGSNHQLDATILPENASDQIVSWSSDNTSVATVSTAGLVSAHSIGQCTITATTVNNLSAKCNITVTPNYNNHAYVDLGLSVNWATSNVGALDYTDYGSYFAWGEIHPKTIYLWSTYELCGGSRFTLTKYNKIESLGTVDNKAQLELDDDAANANWGGSWRIPTITEWGELIDNCTIKHTYVNGVNAVIFTSKVNGYTDKSIVIPKAGVRTNGYIEGEGSSGVYWSSSLYKGYSYYAQDVALDPGRITKYYYERFLGLSIRPVTDK